MLENEGREVETCSDGNAALEKICGHTRYDLLLLGYDLPGVNGLELVSRTRKLVHRACTPIVVLSATPVGAAALEFGTDVFCKNLKMCLHSLKLLIGYLGRVSKTIEIFENLSVEDPSCEGTLIFHQRSHS
jgi:CheY-like chemotaxis protein